MPGHRVHAPSIEPIHNARSTSGCGDHVCAILMSVGKCWPRAKLPATPPRSTQPASESSGVPRASGCRRPLPPSIDGPKFGQDALQILQIGGHPLRIAPLSEAAAGVRPTLGHGALEAQRLLCLRPAQSSWQAGQYHQCGEPLFRHSVVGRKRRRHRRQGHSMRHLLRRPLRDRRLRRAAVRAAPRRRRTAIPTLTRCTFRTSGLRSRVSQEPSGPCLSRARRARGDSTGA